MLLNIGPHHPATHGVLQPEVTLDDELVADVESDVGYIHRREEQMSQPGTYRHQTMPSPDRWDWGGAGLLNEWAYARTAETLADIDVPEYALDVVGDFTATFTYAITERETVPNVLEDLPERLEGFHDLPSANGILRIRTVDTGRLDPEVAKSYGCTGPVGPTE